MKQKVLCGFVAGCVFLNLLIGFKILNSSAAADDHGIDYAAIAGFTRAIQVIRQDAIYAQEDGVWPHACALFATLGTSSWKEPGR